MRYYRIYISSGQLFSSLTPSGQNDPNALRVSLSIEKQSYMLSGNTSFVRIYGVNLDTLSQASNFNGAHVTVYGGFWKGLPLATLQAAHSGLLVDATVWAASGNWKGNETTLDLLLIPSATSSGSSGGNGQAGGLGPSGIGSSGSGPGSGGQSVSNMLRRSLPKAYAPGVKNRRPTTKDDGSGGGGFGDLGSVLSSDFSSALSALASAFGGGGFLQTPANLIHNMQPGQWLGDAIKQTLSTAYSGANIVTNISQSLKTAYQDSGIFQNLQQLVGYYKPLGQSLAKGGLGLDLYAHGNTIHVTDWTQPPATIQLAYTDLIGQPTWIGPNEVFFSTVMRADLIPAVTTVSFPRTIFAVDLAAGGFNAARVTSNLHPSLRMTFNSNVWLHKVRHVGDSRSPDGQAWRTDCWAWVVGSPEQLQGAGLQSISGGIVGNIIEGGLSSIPQSVIDQNKRFTARKARRW